MRNFLRDETGAVLLEYTVLITVMLGGALSVLIVVGPWLEGEWSTLWEALQCTLPETAEPCIPPGQDK